MKKNENEGNGKKPRGPVMEAIYAVPRRTESDDPRERRPRGVMDPGMVCVYAGPEFFENRWKKHPEEDAPVPPEDAPAQPEAPEYPENYDEKEAPAGTAAENAEEEPAPPVPQPSMMMTYAGPSVPQQGFFAALKEDGEEELDEEKIRAMREAIAGPGLMGLVMAPPHDRGNVLSFADMAGKCPSGSGNTAPKFCPNCGSAAEEGANYCKYCGAKLVKDQNNEL